MSETIQDMFTELRNESILFGQEIMKKRILEILKDKNHRYVDGQGFKYAALDLSVINRIEKL